MNTMGLSTSQKVAALLLPASGVLLYWLYRLNSKSDEEIYGSYKKVTTSRSTVIEVSVPRRAVGAVIGRQGCRIKEVQKQSGTRITFRDKGEGSDGLASDHKVAVIHGTMDAAHQAELMIQQMISDIPEPITEQVEVPGYCLGRIIGKGGSSIREMTQGSGARIMVDRNQEGGPDTLRIITITGAQAQIDIALEMINEKLEQEEKFRNKVKVMGANRDERRHEKPEKREHIKNKTVTLDQSPWGDDAPDASSVREENLPLTDGYLRVYLSAVEHPGHFWLQVVGSKALHLEGLQTELTAWVDTQEAREEYQVSTVSPGELVAAKFDPNDPVYYRAKVLGEGEGGTLDLYFVDYGDNSFVDQAQVVRLRSDFASFPFQAIECTLAEVKPTGDTDKWSDESSSAFEEMTHCAQWKLLNARVVPHADQVNPWPVVELYDCNTDQTINIAEEMIKQGYACIADKSKRNSCVSTPKASSGVTS